MNSLKSRRRLTFAEEFFLNCSGECSGKLKLDTEEVFFVHEMYNGRQRENITGQKRLRSKQEAYHENTKEERLDIGRRIYDSEINRYVVTEQYGISDQTAWNYMRMYRNTNGLAQKRGKRTIVTPSFQKTPVCMEELESMTKEQLIQKC